MDSVECRKEGPGRGGSPKERESGCGSSWAEGEILSQVTFFKDYSRSVHHNCGRLQSSSEEISPTCQGRWMRTKPSTTFWAKAKRKMRTDATGNGPTVAFVAASESERRTEAATIGRSVDESVRKHLQINQGLGFELKKPSCWR